MNFETHADVVKFIEDSPSHIPNDLIISDLKWKYLVRSVLRGNNILMTGPSGAGKTLAARSLGVMFPEREFFSFNLGATQDARSTLIGNTHYSPDEGTFLTEALFVRAIQTPNAMILLDEMSRAHMDAINILMTVLDSGQRYLRIDESPETPTINVAEGVSFISTANVGAEYTATKVMDRALMDRFQIIEMDVLTTEQEVGLLSEKFPEVDAASINAVAELAHHTRVVVMSDDPKVTTIISTRQTVEMASLINDGFSLGDAAEVCIYPFYSQSGGTESQRTYMKMNVQKYINTGIGGDDPWAVQV